MIGKPKFNKDDRVKFKINRKEKTGSIYIIDEYGTFFDDSDVSYDIMVDRDEDHGGLSCLYKHISEKFVSKA